MSKRDATTFTCDAAECGTTVTTDRPWSVPDRWVRMIGTGLPASLRDRGETWLCPEHAAAVLHALTRPDRVLKQAESPP